MFSIFLSVLMALLPLAPQDNQIQFDVRARQNLLFGRGEKTGAEYYDVVITRQPTAGVLVKLPYTRKGGEFSFDLHHRLSLGNDFGLPAEVTTIVEILTGGTTSLGVFSISNKIGPGDKFDENIVRISKAEIDRYVTPLSSQRITLKTIPGPQSLSIVGQALVVTRGTTTTRIDTPGTRMASVSNFKFEETSQGTPLEIK